jgi:hypothetical protein
MQVGAGPPAPAYPDHLPLAHLLPFQGVGEQQVRVVGAHAFPVVNPQRAPACLGVPGLGDNPIGYGQNSSPIGAGVVYSRRRAIPISMALKVASDTIATGQRSPPLPPVTGSTKGIVAVGVGVLVLVGIGVHVGLGVFVGVLVGVLVLVGLGVLVAVGVNVGVWVGVRLGVSVGGCVGGGGSTSCLHVPTIRAAMMVRTKTAAIPAYVFIVSSSYSL